MHSIICVTEFTERTLEAARVAAAFARKLGERVVLVRSVDERGQFPYPLRARLIHQDSRQLGKEAQRLRQLGFEFGEKVLRGMPEDGIAEFAWKSGAHVVIVGSTPTGTLEHWALGCLSEEIADTSLVPVLAVRSAAPFERWLDGTRPLNVWVGVDPAARPDALLNRLDELRQMGPCTITAGFVVYPEHRYSRPIFGSSPGAESEFGSGGWQALTDRNVAIRQIHAANHAEAALVAEAETAQADLLVVTSHPHTDLTLLPHRSLSQRVLRRAAMNVMCVPEAAVEAPLLVSTLRHDEVERQEFTDGRRRTLGQPDPASGHG